MIAQVLRPGPPPPSALADPEAFRAKAEELSAKGAAAEGSRELLVLVDPQTNEGLIIQVFDDQESLERYRTGLQQDLIKETPDGGADGLLSSEQVYEVAFRG